MGQRVVPEQEKVVSLKEYSKLRRLQQVDIDPNWFELLKTGVLLFIIIVLFTYIRFDKYFILMNIAAMFPALLTFSWGVLSLRTDKIGILLIILFAIVWSFLIATLNWQYLTLKYCMITITPLIGLLLNRVAGEKNKTTFNTWGAFVSIVAIPYGMVVIILSNL